jgi:hypothetical protein
MSEERFQNELMRYYRGEWKTHDQEMAWLLEENPGLNTKANAFLFRFWGRDGRLYHPHRWINQG